MAQTISQRVSGIGAARALEQHFARVGRAEVVRLRRKLATFDVNQRATVEAAVAQGVNALAAGPVRVLAAQPEQHVVDTLVHLFGLTGADEKW